MIRCLGVAVTAWRAAHAWSPAQTMTAQYSMFDWPELGGPCTAGYESVEDSDEESCDGAVSSCSASVCCTAIEDSCADVMPTCGSGLTLDAASLGDEAGESDEEEDNCCTEKATCADGDDCPTGYIADEDAEDDEECPGGPSTCFNDCCVVDPDLCSSEFDDGDCEDDESFEGDNEHNDDASNCCEARAVCDDFSSCPGGSEEIEDNGDTVATAISDCCDIVDESCLDVMPSCASGTYLDLTKLGEETSGDDDDEVCCTDDAVCDDWYAWVPPAGGGGAGGAGGTAGNACAAGVSSAAFLMGAFVLSAWM